MLDGKVCIVAGGGHGIGKETAKQLADHGATVVVNDLGTDLGGEGASAEPAEEVATEIRDAGGEATAHFGDISSVEYTRELVADTVEEYGRIDGAVNFAGILRDRLLANMTPDEWDPVIRVHLRGHYALFHSLADHWVETDAAAEHQRSFLSVSSESAFGNPGQANYAAAKAGILGLTRTGARELHNVDVRVNALMPRAFTRMAESIPDEHQPDESEIPDPADIPPMVTYLMSEAATDVTGCTILMTGDEFGLVSDPEITTVAYNEAGWSADDIAASFRRAFDHESLTRTDPRI
jgi:NAD(P)-dependent dehydrogenase (short-subunit alcohol dehydrogenase family)